MIRPRAGGDRYRALARKGGRAAALPFALGAVSGCTSTLPGPALRAVPRGADGRPVVVLAHHPLVSGGLHGAFPLLPERFSLRPGFTRQDLAHPANRRMRRMLEPARSENPPLLYASGHDHSLRLIRGGGARYTAVSGAGMYGHTSRVRPVPGTLYARRASGFMRLSMLADGGARLTVLVVDASGAAREEFSLSLRGEPALQAR